MTTISLIAGDITQQPVDAIVNAANPELAGGGGVDGRDPRRRGPLRIRGVRSYWRLRNRRRGGHRRGRLPARWIIHAVGPVWRGGAHGEDAALVRCHSRAIDLAIAAGCRSVAFPAISCGVYGFPVERAAPLALAAARSADRSPLEEIQFALFEPTVWGAGRGRVRVRRRRNRRSRWRFDPLNARTASRAG